MRLGAPRFLAVLAVGLLILACGGGGGPSVDPAFLAYKGAADKILQDYDVAMNDVATIDNNLLEFPSQPARITPDTAVEQLERVFIPKLAAVAKQASELATPDYPELTAAHRPLAMGLNGKVEAYRGMADAYKKRDAANFDKAFKKLLESDAIVKRYRSYLQKWSEQGRITELPAESAEPAAPAAPAPGVPGLPPIPGGPTN